VHSHINVLIILYLVLCDCRSALDAGFSRVSIKFNKVSLTKEDDPFTALFELCEPGSYKLVEIPLSTERGTIMLPVRCLYFFLASLRTSAAVIFMKLYTYRSPKSSVMKSRVLISCSLLFLFPAQ
jgi:hypothetical protein